MNLGISQEALDAANEALGRYIAIAGDEFYNSSANCAALRKQLQEMGIPLDNWGGEGAENVWAAAAFQCRRAGLLESAPLPESNADRIARLQARDRQAGSRLGNQIQDKTSPLDKVTELKKGIQNKQKAIRDGIRKAVETDEAKKARENNWGLVPTELEIRNGRVLTEREFRSLSSEQGRLYVRRLAMIEDQNKIVANEERKKRYDQGEQNEQ
jgi:hypothetical protein